MKLCFGVKFRLCLPSAALSPLLTRRYSLSTPRLRTLWGSSLVARLEHQEPSHYQQVPRSRNNTTELEDAFASSNADVTRHDSIQNVSNVQPPPIKAIPPEIAETDQLPSPRYGVAMANDTPISNFRIRPTDGMRPVPQNRLKMMLYGRHRSCTVLVVLVRAGVHGSGVR